MAAFLLLFLMGIFLNHILIVFNPFDKNTVCVLTLQKPVELWDWNRIGYSQRLRTNLISYSTFKNVQYKLEVKHLKDKFTVMIVLILIQKKKSSVISCECVSFGNFTFLCLGRLADFEELKR